MITLRWVLKKNALKRSFKLRWWWRNRCHQRKMRKLWKRIKQDIDACR